MSDIDIPDADAPEAEQDDVEVITNAEPEDTEDDPAPADTESEETTETDAAEPDAEAIAIAKVMKRYGCDEKVAKVIREQAKFIGKQSNEIGKLRQPPEEPTPADDAEPEGDTAPEEDFDDPDITGIPASPVAPPTGGITTPTDADTLPDAFFQAPPRDWRQDKIDPESGLPMELDPKDGQWYLYEPNDPLGIPFKPDSYWQARAKAISAQYKDNPVYASEVLRREQAQAQAEYTQEYHRKIGEAEGFKSKVLGAEAARLAVGFGKRFPEPIAKGLAAKYAQQADAIIKDNVAKGQIPPHLAYSKPVISLALKIVRAEAEDDGTLEKDVAAMQKPNGGTKPAVKPKPGVMPRPGTKPAPPVGGKPGGPMTAADKAKYGAKSTRFED